MADCFEADVRLTHWRSRTGGEYVPRICVPLLVDFAPFNMPEGIKMQKDPRSDRTGNLLVVIPCLNEAGHIGRLLRQLKPAMQRLDGRVVVADGGSTDGTVQIVQEIAASDDHVTLMHNPQKIQSVAVNMAVAQDAGRAEYLIRIDAHCAYPDDFCDVLMRQARSVHADSIVVSMIAEGDQTVQRINAATQNASFGNGGSAHRSVPSGTYVDHGHHALIKVAAFSDVGGYDPTFTHNEDAELDYRLRQAGYRIWLTSATTITYYPRRSWWGVGRQYFNYGTGRARNLLKHSVLPRLRQTKVMMVFPAVLLALLSPVHWIFAIPALIWVIYCLSAGIRMARRDGDPTLILCGVSAIIMHLSWSVGFWQQVIRELIPQTRRVAR
ncbi:succinoglycan biosynthesis protein ExoA [Jannaschia helgolandensis]|uniref:Succinoglycan biosynthesis protein ExoA n=2 Tax=Jannaschia helgolandensis TaxID=188906 RepID=A0A1H7SAG9_9RHOB|nr:succinoglycan biosynthesis protein ExoA [Jannaschia helgolandensis]